ncbi:MAG: hemerythrin domain-containing protein [Candidatus Phosphoribacter sp.]|nr:hemerythrin domain-containing protein [Actinomycetales bacterium]
MCSYCGCEEIAIIGRFMAEHVEIVNASGDLRRAVHDGDQAPVAHAAEALANLLWPHTLVEERGLFAVLRRQEDFRAEVDALCAEHVRLDDQLSRIGAGQTEVLDVFLHDLRNHIDREENGLFPAAAIALDGDEWDEVDAYEPAPDTHG